MNALVVVQRHELEQSHLASPPEHALACDIRSGKDTSCGDDGCTSGSSQEARRAGDADGRKRCAQACSDDRSEQSSRQTNDKSTSYCCESHHGVSPRPSRLSSVIENIL